MHEKLKKLFPCLPKIPGKTIKKLKSDEGINKRKELLELFVRECIFRDFKDALSNNNINNLDIETYNGKIIIRKINIKETTNQ